jgi:hypothetical protein
MKAYEYNRIKYLTFDLINVYHSVNDKATVEAVYAQTVSEVQELSDEMEFTLFLEKLADSKMTKEQAERDLLDLKKLVEPFALPSESQLKKIFKKVKKLKVPAQSAWDMREITYFSWNEISSNRKYIVTADGRGFYGTLSGNLKNICAICQKTSQVTQFLATTKRGSDGTYTKNGTYICVDGDTCNRQIQKIEGFERFLEIIKER